MKKCYQIRFVDGINPPIENIFDSLKEAREFADNIIQIKHDTQTVIVSELTHGCFDDYWKVLGWYNKNRRD